MLPPFASHVRESKRWVWRWLGAVCVDLGEGDTVVLHGTAHKGIILVVAIGCRTLCGAVLSVVPEAASGAGSMPVVLCLFAYGVVTVWLNLLSLGRVRVPLQHALGRAQHGLVACPVLKA